jgi:hypothetical protein
MLLHLKQLNRRNKHRNVLWTEQPTPVPWFELDYGVIKHRTLPKWGNPGVEIDELMAAGKRIGWNYEQAARRALRSLERRGLVKLGRYSFRAHAIEHQRRSDGSKSRQGYKLPLLARRPCRASSHG